jgi:lambda repressor-like predicted transcriptional regulator
MDAIDWNKRAKNVLRAEMTRKGVTVRELAERLGESERNLANKISRGTFTASFMLQCLDAIGSQHLHLD